jgi:hypothetical protein
MLGGYLVWYIKIFDFGSSYLELGLIFGIRIGTKFKARLGFKIEIKIQT